MSEKNRINVAVISAGNRGRYVTGNLLRDSGGHVNVVSVYDPDDAVVDEAIQYWKSPDTIRCSSFSDAIHAPGVDWVLVFSPNAFHKEHIIAAFQAGKHVFSEKPLATSIADCKEIYDAHIAGGKIFATGFVLRYSPMYRKVRELLDSGEVGKLIAIEGNENITPVHGGYIMCNWRRHTSMAGPHILEKCCHDLDLINWFCDSLPTRVAAFGGRNFFTADNRGMEEKYGVKTFKALWDPHATETPFTDDSDLMDNTVCIAQFRNQVRVTFAATMSNIIPERRLYFSCSEGTITVELYSLKLRYRRLNMEGEVEINFSGDGHGGGDDIIMKELYETMSTGAAPKCGGREGLDSAVFAMALDQAAASCQVVELEPVWASLGR